MKQLFSSQFDGNNQRSTRSRYAILFMDICILQIQQSILCVIFLYKLAIIHITTVQFSDVMRSGILTIMTTEIMIFMEV
jgi:hypothetical protein